MARIRYNVFAAACPSRAVLELLADKWTLLVICALIDGPQRFTELRRHIGGVTQKMLTQTLRALERNGLATRTVYDTTPPSVEYALTPLGRSVTGLMAQMRDWAQDNTKGVMQAQARYDARLHADAAPLPGVRVVRSGQPAQRKLASAA